MIVCMLSVCVCMYLVCVYMRKKHGNVIKRHDILIAEKSLAK